jgi:hypothetical protein
VPLIILPRHATGEVITAGWSNDISDNFLGVDARTGGDPGVAGYLLVASSPTQGVWRYLQTGDYRPGTIPDSAMQYLPVHGASPYSTNFGSLLAANRSGFYQVYPGSGDGPIPGTQNFYCINLVEPSSPTTLMMQIAVNVSNVNDIYLREVINGNATAWYKIWHAGNDGINSTLDADTVRGFVPLKNTIDTMTPGPLTVIRQILGPSAGLYSSAHFVAQSVNAAANPGEIAAVGFLRNGLTGVALFHDAGGWLRMIDASNRTSDFFHTYHMGSGSGLDADTVRTRAPSVTSIANGIPIAGADGKIDASWLPSANIAGVPAGLIAIWLNPGAPPTGWVTVTGMAGLIPIGANATFGFGASGGAQTHAHNINHTHVMDHGHASQSSGTASGTVFQQVNEVTPGSRLVLDTHTHLSNVSGLGGSTPTQGVPAGSQTITANHMPPWIGVNYIQKQ